MNFLLNNESNNNQSKIFGNFQELVKITIFPNRKHQRDLSVGSGDT